MDIEKLIDEIEPNDLPKSYKRYAQSIGIRNLYMLSQLVGERAIYIPSMSFVARGFKYACILREFDGTNLSLLATKYNVSERTIMSVMHFSSGLSDLKFRLIKSSDFSELRSCRNLIQSP